MIETHTEGVVLALKIMFLADGGSPHTIKWARSLAAQGYQILIFGLAKFSPDLYKNEPNIKAYSLDVDEATMKSGYGSWKKLKYLSGVFKVRKLIKEFRPDILHVHFVSSYGLIASLSGFPKVFMSVWGADVYDFPQKSFLHRFVLKFILSKAKILFSTSHVMVHQAAKFTTKPIHVISFGIDIKKFYPAKTELNLFDGKNIIIGTVKLLEEKYGIDVTINAFKHLRVKYPELPLKLLIVGKGTKENDFKDQVKKLNLVPDVHFTGWIPIERVPQYHNYLDISVFPSDSESFGVAAVEASGCAKPVIVSRVGGLVEVVEENKTGLVVPPRNEKALAEAMEKLVLDPSLRSKLGEAGRNRVMEIYDWDKNLRQMMEFYEKN